jgi:transcriptional regulator GlxA family with amidase domain
MKRLRHRRIAFFSLLTEATKERLYLLRQRSVDLPIQMTLPSVMKKVVVLALPGARELDLASVLDILTFANWQLAPNPVYQIEVTSDAKGRVTGMTGLQLVGNAPYFACTGEIDTLLIAGGVSLVRSDPEEPSLVAWL